MQHVFKLLCLLLLVHAAPGVINYFILKKIFYYVYCIGCWLQVWEQGDVGSWHCTASWKVSFFFFSAFARHTVNEQWSCLILSTSRTVCYGVRVLFSCFTPLPSRRLTVSCPGLCAYKLLNLEDLWRCKPLCCCFAHIVSLSIFLFPSLHSNVFGTAHSNVP